jgi:regulator of cell morphogenesis and NO signaling
MSSYDSNVPVWELVRGCAGRARVLEGFKIDYCCGGRTPLKEACFERGLNVEEVVRALEANDDAQPAADQINWSGESMTRLANHIVSRHHVYLREMLPQLGSLLDKVVMKHAERHPNLVDLREVYATMWNELLSHMMKEELVLFPFIRSLDQAATTGQPVPRFHCGSVAAPIHVMEDEHQSVGEALRRMRELTCDFRAPADACDAYRVLLAGLRELERDLHLHIHKENNILFPRAAAVEASQSSAVDKSLLTPDPSTV